MTRHVRWLASGFVVALLLAGCADETGADEPPDPAPTPEPTPEPESTWPLTGLPAPDGAGELPAMVVKVDNTGPADPQHGLSSADIVVEELVEGGMTRLAVMYHSAWPDEVVPVRSVRTSDIGLVLPTGGALVASGGAERVLRQMDDAGVPVLLGSEPGFSRVGSRNAPYNVAVDLERLAGDNTELGQPAQSYLPWADAAEALPGGAPVEEMEATFSGAHTTAWTWDGEAWRRSRELAADGDAFEPDTVLVFRVETRDAGYRDPAGNPVPETVLEGTGEALLFADGRVIEGQWSKDDAAAPFALTDDAGAPLPVPPGRTWIELVPAAGGDVSWTRP